jgi:hypothetical protein
MLFAVIKVEFFTLNKLNVDKYLTDGNKVNMDHFLRCVFH